MTEHPSLIQRMKLTQQTLAQLAKTRPDCVSERLLGRLLMPTGLGVDLALYRQHVSELLTRAKADEPLDPATAAEVLHMLARWPSLNRRASDLLAALQCHLRQNTPLDVPEPLLFDRLRELVVNRPLRRGDIRKLIQEEDPWTAPNGQAA